ncbi:MAG: ImmA/IrrE family metallo-endopeptidase [Patescibacteria group bacterium]|nr:ImmA/IrrE family metallo-endopeptidase [Patescibacteria group bacterium]
MNPDKIKEIEGKALDLLITVFSEENAFSIPIDVSKIAKTLELSLKEGNFIDKEIVGAYDRSLKTIYIAKSDPYTRKTFTIAHEMGHFILHDEKNQETFYRKDLIFVGKEDKPQEQEANCFAASLLMPKGTILRYLKITKNVELLADFFGVSYSAMSLRLKNLGFFD